MFWRILGFALFIIALGHKEAVFWWLMCLGLGELEDIKLAIKGSL